MATDLYISGAASSSNLYIGTLDPGASYFEDAVGTVLVTGYPVSMTGAAESTYLEVVAGVVTVVVIPADLAQSWRELAPPGFVVASGAPASFQHVRVEVQLEATPGGVSVTGLVADVKNIKTQLPRYLFPGYDFDGTTLSIPIADLLGVTAAEADAVTGDWREVLQAILLRAVEYHRSFTWSEQLRTYNAFVMNQLNNSTYNRYFSITFYTHQCGANVVQEP